MFPASGSPNHALSLSPSQTDGTWVCFLAAGRHYPALYAAQIHHLTVLGAARATSGAWVRPAPCSRLSPGVWRPGLSLASLDMQLRPLVPSSCPLAFSLCVPLGPCVLTSPPSEDTGPGTQPRRAPGDPHRNSITFAKPLVPEKATCAGTRGQHLDAACGRRRSSRPVPAGLDPVSPGLGGLTVATLSSRPGLAFRIPRSPPHLLSVSPITGCPFGHPPKGGLACCDPPWELHLETLLPPGRHSGHRFLLRSDPAGTPSLGNPSRFLGYQLHASAHGDPEQRLFGGIEGSGAGREGCGHARPLQAALSALLKCPGIFFMLFFCFKRTCTALHGRQRQGAAHSPSPRCSPSGPTELSAGPALEASGSATPAAASAAAGPDSHGEAGAPGRSLSSPGGDSRHNGASVTDGRTQRPPSPVRR